MTDMTEKERKEGGRIGGDAVLFAGLLFLLLIFAGAGFERLSEGQENLYDHLKTSSIDYRIKKRGYIEKYVDSGYLAYGVEPIGYLLDGLVVEQDFTVTEEMLLYDEMAVGIEVATYGRKNNVNLYVELSQGNGFGKAYKIECRNLKDNKDVNIPFPTEGLAAGDCHVKLYSDASSGNEAVTVYTTLNCALAPDMTVAGSKRERNLVMNVFTPYGAKAK